MRLLLSRSDPKARDSEALRWAACNGHAECVRLLLPVSDPNGLECLALLWAAQNGCVECVRLLLPASGTLLQTDRLLDAVIEGGHANVAALLIEQEPRLLDGVDLAKQLETAVENDHGDLASYLLSIIDQRELLAVARNRPKMGLGLARL